MKIYSLILSALMLSAPAIQAQETYSPEGNHIGEEAEFTNEEMELMQRDDRREDDRDDRREDREDRWDDRRDDRRWDARRSSLCNGTFDFQSGFFRGVLRMRTDRSGDVDGTLRVSGFGTYEVDGTCRLIGNDRARVVFMRDNGGRNPDTFRGNVQIDRNGRVRMAGNLVSDRKAYRVIGYRR